MIDVYNISHVILSFIIYSYFIHILFEMLGHKKIDLVDEGIKDTTRAILFLFIITTRRPSVASRLRRIRCSHSPLRGDENTSFARK